MPQIVNSQRRWYNVLIFAGIFYFMLFYLLSAFLNAATSIILGIFVYLHNRKSELNRYFGLFSLSVAFWSIGYLFWQFAKQQDIALFWVRILMLGAIFIPVFYFHFVASLVGFVQRVKPVLVLGYLLAFIFAFFDLFTSYFIQDVSPKLSFPFWPNPGIVFHLFLLMFFGYVCYSWYLLILVSRKAYGLKKAQIQYVFLGTFIGFIGGSTNYFLWYDIPIPPVGNWAIAVYIGMIAYAIVKKQLFGIRVVLTQLLVGIIAILLFINIFPSQTLFEYSWKIALLTAFLIVGYLLIKSVLKEIKYREELQKAYEELKKLDAAKSEFISMASHQLRTPLSAIKGYISMLIEGSYGQISEKAKEKLANVFQSNERLLKIVNELLNISRIELGKVELTKESTQIENLIKSCHEEMKIEAEKKNLKLIWQKPKKPLPKINVDSFKIRQTILNLIDNALKYTKEGEIEIKAKKTNSTIQVSVRDTGEGLTKEEQQNIFESFTRGGAGIAYWIEGAGLGLYVAKKYLELHQGTIRAESEGKGKGSIFYIELPIK